ncbi:MAG: Pup--protein ligase [Actinomycetaceae bacterium]|nr:Pup--protein ligase [Actinomycetaceae bacterium]
MRRRVIGIETEYGLTSATTTGQPSALDADGAARELFLPYLHRGRSTNLFLRNGGRLYLDVGSHPEYATAECDRIEDLLAQDRAGSAILADLAAVANTRLAEAGQPERLHLFRNNLDSVGNSYGCHENYLLHRRRDFRQVADALVAFFVTRQLFVGSGYIRPGESGPTYAFSQRSEQMWDAVSSATTRSRPIINTRDEPLADSGSYRRMHVIVGDTNVCEATTALKVGAAELLLSAVEEGLRIEDLALADAMQSIRDLNGDLQCRTTVELADGRRWTGPQIQAEIRERVLSRTDEASLSPLHRYVLDLWGRAVEALSSGDWSGVATELDVAAKRQLLESYCASHQVSLADPRVARLELCYHEITAEGIAPRMEKAGLLRRLTTPDSVEAARTVAPQSTRAHLRGAAIAAAEEARVDMGVDWVHLRVEGLPVAPVALQDPFATRDARIDALIEAMRSSSSELPA